MFFVAATLAPTIAKAKVERKSSNCKEVIDTNGSFRLRRLLRKRIAERVFRGVYQDMPKFRLKENLLAKE